MIEILERLGVPRTLMLGLYALRGIGYPLFIRPKQPGFDERGHRVKQEAS